MIKIHCEGEESDNEMADACLNAVEFSCLKCNYGPMFKRLKERGRERQRDTEREDLIIPKASGTGLEAMMSSVSPGLRGLVNLVNF